MPEFSSIQPFGGEEVEEVPLPSAPLVGVIAQVRFPPVLALGGELSAVAAFQDAVRDIYPVLRSETSAELTLSPELVALGQRAERIWRFVDLEANWRVSLASSFVSLDVANYTSRTEFLERFDQVLRALREKLEVKAIDRVGVRYVDRVLLEEGHPPLGDLFRGEVLGLASSDLGSGKISQTVTDTLFQTDVGTLRARWGLIPGGMVLDPLHGPAPDSPSWVLDLDMYSASDPREFVPREVTRLAGIYASRIYRFFRWAVSDEFLAYYGGGSYGAG